MEILEAAKDEGFGGVGADLVVLGEATKVVEPAKGRFDHPASGQNLEAGLGAAAPDDLQAQRTLAATVHTPTISRTGRA